MSDWNDEEFLRVLSAVQEQQEAGCFAGQANLALLLRRVPRLMEELIRLRVENGRLREEQAAASASQGVLSFREMLREPALVLEVCADCGGGGQRRICAGCPTCAGTGLISKAT